MWIIYNENNPDDCRSKILGIYKYKINKYKYII